MVSKFATKVSILALVLGSLAAATGCSSMSAAVAPATSATKSDSRSAHFDRENLDHTFL